MKKILALTLAVMMMATVFAACGGTTPATSTPASSTATSTAAESTATAPAETTVPDNEVTIKWMTTGNSVTDDKAVMEKVNEYLKEKINAKLEMNWATWGDFDDKATMAINGGDDIDIYFTCFWSRNEYVSYSKRGAYLKLDDLIAEYAPNYFDGMHPAMRDGSAVDGSEGYGIYALPAAKEVAVQYVWEMNMPVLSKYDITADDITDFYELGPVLQKVKEGEGADFYPFSNDTTILAKVADPSVFVDSQDLLTYQFDPVNPSKSENVIKSRFETEGFEKFANKMREYYQAGYVDPAQALEPTMATSWTDAKTTGKWAISTRSAAPAYNFAESGQYGYEIAIKNAMAGVIDTNGPRGAMHAVSALSANPDRAVQLLNLVNSDVYLHDLLGYGVEGVHYNLENGKVAFTDEKQNYIVWKAGMGQLAMYTPTVDDPDNIQKIIEDFNTVGVEALPSLGFSFDPEPVNNEIAALANVRSEFFWSLAAGSVDPATELPRFIEKLKANGIDKLVEEANKQLQAATK